MPYFKYMFDVFKASSGFFKFFIVWNLFFTLVNLVSYYATGELSNFILGITQFMFFIGMFYFAEKKYRRDRETD